MAYQLPPAIKTSRLLIPWICLASLSVEDLGQITRDSSVIQQLTGFFKRPFEWVWYLMAPHAKLHQMLQGLHIGLVLLFLMACSFASTGQIGVLVLAAFAILLLRVLLKPLGFRLTIVDVMVILFFATALLATAFSSYVATSMVGLGKFMVFVAGYLNVRLIVEETPGMLQKLLILLVVLGFVQALIGFYQYINHVQPLATWQDPSLNPEQVMTRVFGSLKPSNPNLLAGFLISALAGGAGLTLKYAFENHRGQAFILLGMTGAILAALVLTGSRGGYLAILMMTLFLFLFVGHLLWHQPELKEKMMLKALWLLVFIGSVVGVVLAVSMLPPLKTRILSIFAMREDSSNSYRMNVWLSTASMIRDNWLVGIGPGNDTFKQVYGLYMIPGYNALSAYSIFLEIWVEQGVLGVLSFLGLLGISAIRTLIGVYSPLSLSQKMMIGLLLTGIIGSVVYGLFDTIWYRPSVNLLFWLFVAGLACTTEQALQGERQG